MSDFYTAAQRRMQEEFEATSLANRIEEAVVTEELSDHQAEFISSRNMFFLSTIDELGYPSCSYKGGDLSFTRVIDPRTIVFPNYDGNGMFMSMGNIEEKIKVGMLFVDFETPQRLRLRGEARCLREAAMLDSYPGANLVVEVSVNHVWVNCPRYVHRMQPLAKSPYLPGEDGKASLALWKRVDLIQDVLRAEDRLEAESLGLITIEEYEACVASGKLL